MYILKIEQLQAGDIILMRSSTRESIMIRQKTGCNYSHAMLYVGLSSIIESDGLGVQSQNLQRILFENHDDVIVLRLIDKKNTVIQQAVNYVRSKIGTEFSASEARVTTSKHNTNAKEKNRQFCTRLVAQAYSSAGVILTETPDYCSPSDIIQSNKLEVINNITRAATSIEIKNATEENQPLEKQKEIHNYILENARNLTKTDIQTIEQLSQYVINNPEKEDEIIDIIQKSGYLDFWETDIRRNPWYYDDKKLISHFTNPIQQKQVGLFLIKGGQDIERFTSSLEACKKAYETTHLRYFKIFVDLYEKLIELSKLRETVGQKVINNLFN